MLLTISLILSAILLTVTGAIIARDHKPGFGTCMLAAFLGAGPVVMGYFMLPCVVLQAVVLIGLTITDSFVGFKSRTYFTAACAGTVLVYVGFGCYQLHRLFRLQSEYAYESMVARLPAKRNASAVQAKPGDERKLTYLEDALTNDRHGYLGSTRERNLERLHENTVDAFINSAGFGVGRMSSLSFSASEIVREQETAETLPQAVRRDLETFSLGDPGTAITGPVDESIGDLHRDSYLDFVNANGFGFFKDRDHVAGFRPHQFRRVPAPAPKWKLETLELLGLAVHEQPVVYVSALLPRMDMLRKAPRRPLDAFEAEALAELREGQTLVVHQHEERIRVLGAVRSVQQCVGCHECTRGELLGAFSYVLRPRA